MAMTLGATDVALIATTTNAVLSPSSQVILTKVTACNTDVSVHGVTVWRVPAGGNVTTSAYELVGNLTVPVGGAPVVLPLSGQPLPAGSSLYAAQDSGTGVNLNIGWMQPG